MITQSGKQEQKSTLQVQTAGSLLLLPQSKQKHDPHML